MAKAKTRLHQKRWAIRLFEWGVLASIILVLMGVFLRRVRHLQGEAERLTVQATIDNMQAAVLLTTVLANGQQLHTEARAGGNPVALLKARSGLEPVDYLGEFSQKGLDEVAPGQWYFDRGQRALIYRLRSAEDFTSSLSGPARIRLCLRKPGASDSGAVPLRLEACESYRWGRDN